MPTESTFLLAGLFLLLAAAGWAMGRFGERDEEDALPPLNIDYLKGLNFLLNEQTDQALEHFLHMVRVDDKTIETHFALGSLFRRRGEVDRAIRIHQNIIARPDLAAEQRDQAIYSLAKDYLAASTRLQELDARFPNPGTKTIDPKRFALWLEARTGMADLLAEAFKDPKKVGGFQVRKTRNNALARLADLLDQRSMTARLRARASSLGSRSRSRGGRRFVRDR